MADLTVTQNEILEAIALAAPGRAPENAMTAAEIAAFARCSKDTVNERIKALHAEGRVVVHTVYRENVTGQRIQKPAYTFLPAKRRSGR